MTRFRFPTYYKPCILGLTAAMAISTSVASASDLVDISVEIDGWTMLPIADAGVTTHIIATRNDDEALFTDVDVVLYKKTTTGWSGEAYDPSVTKEDALIDIATEFVLTNPIEGDWLVGFDELDVLNYVVPRAKFGVGFFVTDPLYLIASQMENPEPLVIAAEDGGHAAGGSAVNTGSLSGRTNIGNPQPIDCGCELCIQDAVASMANLRLSDPALAIDKIIMITAALPGFQCPCYYRVTTAAASTPWTPWACGGWTTTLNANTGICTSTTIASRSKNRVMTTTCISCISGISTITWTQIKNQSGSVSVRGGVNANGTCTPPSNCPAPANPTGGWFWTPPFGPACPRP